MTSKNSRLKRPLYKELNDDYLKREDQLDRYHLLDSNFEQIVELMKEAKDTVKTPVCLVANATGKFGKELCRNIHEREGKPEGFTQDWIAEMLAKKMIPIG